MRFWASTFAIALISCVTTLGRGEECGALRPGPGPFEWASLDHISAVHRLLLAVDTRGRVVQFVRLSASEPTDEAVYIIDRHEHDLPPRKSDYEVVSVRARVSILEAISRDGPMAKVAVDTLRVPVDPILVAELRKTWQLMIRQASFPSTLDMDGLDTEYHFTAWLDVGPGSAYVVGPPRGGCTAAFAELGELLFQYATDARQRSSLREKLVRKARELRARVSQIRDK